MRRVSIAKRTGGMNVMRSKGGASPDDLSVLENGWVTPKGVIAARPGLRRVLGLPPGSVGLASLNGKYHVFSHLPLVSGDSRVVVNVLRHPTGGTAALSKIHRALPFLGKFYVVAEFTDGVVKHYWLDVSTAWAATTQILFNGRVIPTIDNGFYYALRTASTVLAWTANTEVAVGQFRQPSVSNNLQYEITAVSGPAPTKTSNTEPTWPTTIGGTVVERRYLTDAQTDPGDSSPPVNTGDGFDPGDDPYYPYGRGKSTGIDSGSP